jgi:hypothetical protein
VPHKHKLVSVAFGSLTGSDEGQATYIHKRVELSLDVRVVVVTGRPGLGECIPSPRRNLGISIKTVARELHE